MSTNRIISIVDDDADITLLFHDILNGITGVTVLTFTDPILALQHFQVNEHAYVLVISDFKMSGLNGMEFLKDQGFKSIRKNNFDDRIPN